LTQGLSGTSFPGTAEGAVPNTSNALCAPHHVTEHTLEEEALTAECEQKLQALAAWCRDLEASPRSEDPPTPEDKAQLDGMLLGIWEEFGALNGVGVPRNSPQQRRFQELLGTFFWQSPIIHRCFAKPRGYAGDFLMMENVYQNVPKGETALGRWLDRWVLELAGFRAVRNRREKVITLLAEEWATGARRVMSVASGSSSELGVAVGTAPFDEITLLDQDAEAIESAMSLLGPRVRPGVLRPVCGTVGRLLNGRLSLETDSQDFTYSMGLYDYLTTPVAQKLTQELWRGLAPGGLLAIGNFYDADPMRYLAEAIMDWYLVYRSTGEMMAFADELPNVEEASVWTDTSGCLHLLLVRKQGPRRTASSSR